MSRYLNIFVFTSKYVLIEITLFMIYKVKFTPIKGPLFCTRCIPMVKDESGSVQVCIDETRITEGMDFVKQCYHYVGRLWLLQHMKGVITTGDNLSCHIQDSYIIFYLLRSVTFSDSRFFPENQTLIIHGNSVCLVVCFSYSQRILAYKIRN